MNLRVFLLGLMFLSPTLGMADSDNLKVIHTEEIRQKLDDREFIMFVDSRTKKVDDGRRLPGAKLLPYDSSEKHINKALPDKNAFIVVYCRTDKCPMSERLINKLEKLGYSNTYKYAEGLEDWIEHGYAFETVKVDKKKCKQLL